MWHTQRDTCTQQLTSPLLPSRPSSMLPEEYKPTIDHAWATDQGWEVQDILAATGREYTPQSYFWRQDDAEWCDQIQQVRGGNVLPVSVGHRDRTSLPHTSQHPSSGAASASGRLSCPLSPSSGCSVRLVCVCVGAPA